jgi:hypothetical protein
MEPQSRIHNVFHNIKILLIRTSLKMDYETEEFLVDSLSFRAVDWTFEKVEY